MAELLVPVAAGDIDCDHPTRLYYYEVVRRKSTLGGGLCERREREGRASPLPCPFPGRAPAYMFIGLIVFDERSHT